MKLAKEQPIQYQSRSESWGKLSFIFVNIARLALVDDCILLSTLLVLHVFLA